MSDLKTRIKTFLKKAASILTAAILIFGAAASVPTEKVSAYSTSSTLVEGCYVIIPKCAQNSCIDISGAGTGYFFFAIGLFLGYFTGKMLPAVWAWQRAMATASAASSGFGVLSRLRNTRVISITCFFSAVD